MKKLRQKGSGSSNELRLKSFTYSSSNSLAVNGNDPFDKSPDLSLCDSSGEYSSSRLTQQSLSETKTRIHRRFNRHHSPQIKLVPQQKDNSDVDLVNSPGYSETDSSGNSPRVPKDDSTSIRGQCSRLLRSKSLSSLNPTLRALSGNDCIAFVHIFNVFNIEQSFFRVLQNSYISITQDGVKLGKTTIKSNSHQPVWDQSLQIPIPSLGSPLLFTIKNRSAMGKFCSIGQSELPLYEFVSNVTYHKYLYLETSMSSGNQVGILRITICIQNTSISSKLTESSSTINSGRNINVVLRKPKWNQNHLAKKRPSSLFNSQNFVENSDTSFKAGPLVCGIRAFENRYMAVLHLSTIAHPSRYYVRRWKPLENQPSDVVMITNQTTKCVEIRSPRLPWPTMFLNGVSALEFCGLSGALVGQFETAILNITVVSVSGLRSLLLSKLFTKYQGPKNSMPRGIIVTEMIANYQSVTQSTDKLSTYVQLQLGKDRFVTKSAKFTYDPVWNQTFVFNINRSSRSLVELQLFNQTNPNISGPASGITKLGEAVMDISKLPMDITQQIELELNGSQSKPRILILATLTGLTKGTEDSKNLLAINKCESESPFENSLNVDDAFKRRSSSSSFEPLAIDAFKEPEVQNKIIEHYSLKNSLTNRYDVGYLKVKVVAAANLQSKDINGKSDPYCVLEVINMRTQTQTIKKTLNPKWDKTFIFPITDIHTCLQITVMDEDKMKSDFLGKVHIPLLKIKNNEPSWYALKDTNLKSRAKGSILLEFFFVYNHVKAAWRTINPPEPMLIDSNRKQKFSKLSPGYINSLRENVIRLKILFRVCGLAGQAFDALCSWENPTKTLCALVGYILVVWNFQPYMIPLVMIIVILINRHPSRSPHVTSLLSSVRAAYGSGASNLGNGYDQIINREASEEAGEEYNSIEDDMMINNELLDSLEKDFVVPSEPEQVKESRQGKNKLATVVDILDDLPTNLDSVASFFERFNGIFYWQVGWITWLSLLFLVVVTAILFLVPLRIILIIIGTNRLTKHILRPSSRSTMEVLNVISRVPSKPEVIMQKRLTPQAFVYPS